MELPLCYLLESRTKIKETAENPCTPSASTKMWSCLLLNSSGQLSLSCTETVMPQRKKSMCYRCFWYPEQLNLSRTVTLLSPLEVLPYLLFWVQILQGNQNNKLGTNTLWDWAPGGQKGSWEGRKTSVEQRIGCFKSRYSRSHTTEGQPSAIS